MARITDWREDLKTIALAKDLAQKISSGEIGRILQGQHPPIESEEFYQLTVSRTQLELIKKGCELQARLWLGQLHEVATALTGQIPIDVYNEIRDQLTHLESLVTQRGITQPDLPEKTQIAYDLWTQIQYRQRQLRAPDDPYLSTPLHVANHPLATVEPAMTIEEAKEINRQIVESSLSRQGFERYEGALLPKGCSLAELLEATRIMTNYQEVRPDGSTSIYMHVNPRWIAAQYAFEHYSQNPYRLLEALGYEVPDDDDS